MFNSGHGLFHPSQKIPAILFAVQSATELLAVSERAVILEKLPALTSIPMGSYHQLYLKAVYNFAECVQELFSTENSYYARRSGLLSQGLERAYRSLYVCRSYFLNQYAAITESQALWLYAVFTAALLLNVGKIVTRQAIALHDKQGAVIKPWSPFEGQMLVLPGVTHYSFHFKTEPHAHLQQLVTPLLARQLLPKAGFDWLSSDLAVLEAWLAMLQGDMSGGGLLPSIIPLIDAQLIEFDLLHQKVPVESGLSGKEQNLAHDQVPQKPPLPKLFTQGLTETGQHQVLGANLPTVATAITNTVTGSYLSSSTIALPAGVAFLQWLKKGLSAGQLSINGATSLVHRTGDGIVLLPKIFTEFSKSNTQFKDAHQIAQQFSQLEIIGRNQTYRYLAESGSTLVKNAVVIKNIFTVLNSDKGLPPLSAVVVNLPPNLTELLAVTDIAKKIAEPTALLSAHLVAKT